jgi:diacylglycerol kinase (ATP)
LPSRPPATAIRTFFLVNPASGGGSTGRRWPELAHAAAEIGLVGEALISERPGHLTELAQQAVAEGGELLVVIGGDGSVNEVVNGVAAALAGGGSRPSAADVDLALVPRGTGDDFARTYKIPRGRAALAVAARGRTTTIDAGRVSFRAWDGSTRDAWFANVASAGMSGAIARRADDTSRALGATVAFAWAILRVFADWRSSEVEVTVDRERRAGRMHDVVVANGRYLAGGIMICPEARPDDALFDVLLIGDLTKRELLVTLPKTYVGRHLPHPKAELLRGTTVGIDSRQPLPIQLDGEQPGTTPVRFELVPGALRLRVPADYLRGG